MPLAASVCTAGEVTCMDICRLSLKSAICMHLQFQVFTDTCRLLPALLHANIV